MKNKIRLLLGEDQSDLIFIVCNTACILYGRVESFILTRTYLYVTISVKIVSHPHNLRITADFYYSLYKKKRKHYIIFNNLSTLKDGHFKLTGYQDWYVIYQ